MTKTLDLPTNKILANYEGAIGHVIFNNPERHNAVSLEMWNAVETALLDFQKNTSIRVVILSLSLIHI